MTDVALQHALASALNRHSAEATSHTPDFVLAEYLGACLDAFDSAVLARSTWYGRRDEPGPAPASPEPKEWGQLRRLREGLARLHYRCPENDGLTEHTLQVMEELIEERNHMREAFESACKTVAEMHEAAVGKIRGPIRGPVEDVLDLRLRAERLEKENAHLRKLLARRAGETATNHRYTRHGHPCCNEVKLSQGAGVSVARCGGPGICARCAQEAGKIHAETPEGA